MKKRFTEEQIIKVLKAHDAGAKVQDLCREHGISPPTLYKWKAKYGGMEASDAKKLKALETENAKLKRLVADLSLDKLMVKNPSNLTPEQQDRLSAYFRKQPAIHNLYLFKEELKAFLMTKNKSRKMLRKEGLIAFFMRLLEQLKDTGFDLFRTLGKTLYAWQEEILRMFVFPYSNGITEGFHRKMKLIQRRAYGFRNFENYRLRVIVLCGHLPVTGL